MRGEGNLRQLRVLGSGLSSMAASEAGTFGAAARAARPSSSQRGRARLVGMRSRSRGWRVGLMVPRNRVAAEVEQAVARLALQQPA